MPRLNASPYKYVECKCQWCGKAFAATVTRAKLGKALYCGEACAKKAKGHLRNLRRHKTTRERKCVICGAEFRPKSTGTTCCPECKAELMRKRMQEAGCTDFNAPKVPEVPMSEVFNGYEEYGKLWGGKGLDAQYTPVL